MEGRERCLSLALLIVLSFFLSASGGSIFIEESGVEKVQKFATVIIFYLELKSTCEETANVTVIPEQCCLVIAKDDIDCDVIELRPPVTVQLTLYSDSKRADFMFRNLYARYRRGNCSFILSSTARKCPVEWKHSFDFSTYPDSGELEIHNCMGIDQDPDRGPCTPVDCAIKYKGKRNFYRNSTGKCEPVVECNTRGEDGVSIVAYYDWDNNFCHRLDWMNDNSFTLIESDTEIPSEIDPSQLTNILDFEPEKLKALAKAGKYKLKCNHGVQNGIYCDCHDGWISSGIHQDDPMTFHWCDAELIDPALFSQQPHKLGRVQEMFVIAFLSLANCILTLVWYYVVYRLFCIDCYRYLCSKAKGSYKYTKLSQHEQ